MKKNLSKSMWLIMTGFSCNNNCLMCSTRPKAKNFPDRTTEEILEDLKRGRKRYTKVEFTGGEPTIRPDILDLVKSAKDLGYEEIAISTNARRLSYNCFCKEIVKNGLNRVTFSLYGHNKQLHEAITRTPNSFEQTLQGVKNVLKNSKVEVSANTVVFKLNYKYLHQIGSLIYSLGIRDWNILDLIPDGYAKDFYDTLSVGLTELLQVLNGLKDIIKNFNLVTFFDFPPCLFETQVRENPQVNLITTKGRMEIGKQVGYEPRRFETSANGSYTDIHKQKIDICNNCIFYQSCGGFWKDYLKLYGDKEIELLSIKHDCILKD